MSDNFESPSQQQPDLNDLETDQGDSTPHPPLTAIADNSSPPTTRNVPPPGRVETQPDGHNLMLLSLCTPPERPNWPNQPQSRTQYRYMSEVGKSHHGVHDRWACGHKARTTLKRAQDVGFDYSSSNPDGHATCILDVIAGLNHGGAKFADIVFCSDQPSEDEDAEVTTKHEHYNRFFKSIADDIESRGLQGKAVICHAGVITDDSGRDGQSYLLERLQLIRNTGDLGVLIVVAGVSERVSERVREEERDVDRQPQDYADRLPILVVDAVDGDGKPYDGRDPESILVSWGHAPALALTVPASTKPNSILHSQPQPWLDSLLACCRRLLQSKPFSIS